LFDCVKDGSGISRCKKEGFFRPDFLQIGNLAYSLTRFFAGNALKYIQILGIL